jgi:hypothetical protein
MRPLRAAGLAAVAALCSACSTDRYSHARETRFDRPCLGGAAAVAADRTESPEPTTFDLLSWLGAVGLGWTHGVDATAPSNQPYAPDAAPRPQR